MDLDNYDKNTQVCNTDTGTADLRTVYTDKQGNGQSVFCPGNTVLSGNRDHTAVCVC